ncbi:MAG: Transcriptional regulator, TraR/DksA family [Parcubacteria group bacterium GW2011_GWB1_41_6]|nr:MAG: Transcriptional regulator, TraR/DksA family [Parcubacteria group bacterium GW2011_GWB1_41_6]KKS34356.1 MAG: Transcriptional regulator, TraR/DksA family [Parcubacteria group bacterium GW2011_GWC2_42_13]KKS56821.1 MAG: Transcriptional regulator, TraR/DksA family [Parcubacteria group bacterium GW2011_GWA2_42_35]
MISKIDYFKTKLLEEKEKLEQDLKTMAKRNPENPDDWEPAPPAMNVMVSDANELADTFEELENVIGVSDQLEERLRAVNQALEKIEKGDYGQCRQCGKEIDEKRLEANPAAAACIKHT